MIYLVACIYLMMKFKWAVKKAIEYLCVKQPCFYLAQQFFNFLRVLEDFLKMKYKDEVNYDWDVSRKMAKQELIITHTYINTRIAPIEKQDGAENDNTVKARIETSVPKNNRNSNQKVNTYDKVKDSFDSGK